MKRYYGLDADFYVTREQRRKEVEKSGYVHGLIRTPEGNIRSERVSMGLSV